MEWTKHHHTSPPHSQVARLSSDRAPAMGGLLATSPFQLRTLSWVLPLGSMDCMGPGSLLPAA